MPIELPSSAWEGTWTHRKNARGDVKGAVLAAGLGRRMEPLTAHLPKPLFPLGGKVPMAELWVRKMVASGIDELSMNLCVLRETIKRHFTDGAKFGATIDYVEEDSPSGTLGGVCKQALGTEAKAEGGSEGRPSLARFRGSTIIAPSGDIVTDFSAELLGEMHDIHKKVGAAFSMVLVPVPWERRKDFGTVVLERPEERSGMISKSGRISDFREKDPESPSNLNNASIYMIETGLLEMLDPLRTEAGVDLEAPFYDFGKHVFPAMLGRLSHVTLPSDALLWGIQYDGKWFDVGQKRDYLRVQEHVLVGELDVRLPYEELPWGYLGNHVEIDFSRVRIRPPVVIGNNCVIEDEVTLGPNAVIGDGWHIGKGAHVRNSILWERYPYYRSDGSQIAIEERQEVDAHRVAPGVEITGSVIAGGDITGNLEERTVDVTENGDQRDLAIDWVPSGPRA